MKNYIVTSRQTGRSQILDEENLQRLRQRTSLHVKYTVEEMPEKKSVPKPKELEQEPETPEPVKTKKTKSDE